VSAIDPGRHPDTLPWHVSGKLDASESEGVAEHLRLCPACRLEVEALRSMRRTLVAYRQDLDLLEESAGADRDTEERPVISARGLTSPWAWGLLGAAAASVVLIAVASVLPGPWRSPPEPALASVTSIVFLPAQRGVEPVRALNGRGPWSIDVMLPLGAPPGEYEVRIDADGDRTSMRLRTTARAANDGRLTVLLRELGAPGRYRLTATPPPTGDPNRGAGYAYAFELHP
jgi:hypothetical protein